jgi:hypothetical protein
MLEEERGRHYAAKDSLIFLQEGDGEIGQFFQDAGLTHGEIADLNHGWTIRKRMHVDTFDHYFGYSNRIDMGY